MLEQTRTLVAATNTEMDHITAWCGVDSLENATEADRNEILRLLRSKQAKMATRQAAAA